MIYTISWYYGALKIDPLTNRRTPVLMLEQRFRDCKSLITEEAFYVFRQGIDTWLVEQCHNKGIAPTDLVFDYITYEEAQDTSIACDSLEYTVSDDGFEPVAKP